MENYGPTGLDYFDYANFPQATLSHHELREQLDTIARQINLKTVSSSTTASSNETFEGDPNLLTVYLVTLSVFLKNGGQVQHVNMPAPSRTSTFFRSDNSSLSKSHAYDKSKDGRGKDGEISRGSRPILSPISGIDSMPALTPPTTANGTPNTGSSVGPLSTTTSQKSVAIQFGDMHTINVDFFNTGSLPDPPATIASKKSVTIQFGDACAIDVDLTSTGKRPRASRSLPFPQVESGHITNSPTSSVSSTALIEPTPATSPVIGPIPQIMAVHTLFIRCAIGGLRIRIETGKWTDIPGIGIYNVQQQLEQSGLPKGVEIMGCDQWISSCYWISRMYHEVLYDEKIRKYEAEQLAKALNKGPIFEPLSNPKPPHKMITYPSGEDLGVNWDASLGSHQKEREANVRVLQEQPKVQEEERDSAWLWYLWKEHGNVRGWTERPKIHGDRARNEGDRQKLDRILLGEKGIPNVGFADMREMLGGESAWEFEFRWNYRNKYLGGPRWEDQWGRW